MYLPSAERQLATLPGERAVAFDEKLNSLGLGRCRAHGVLVERGGAWRIHRYGLDCASQPLLPLGGP